MWNRSVVSEAGNRPAREVERRSVSSTGKFHIRKPRLSRVLSAVLALSILLNAFAFAAEDGTVCPIEAHVHTSDCYAPELICGQEERAPATETRRSWAADFAPHTHTTACRNDAGELACGYVQGEYYHVHNSWCYDDAGNLACGLDEHAPHVHSGDCYTETTTLSCGQEESAGHQHAEDCYRQQTNLICGLAETPGHVHTDDCYIEEPVLSCGQEESAGHVHTGDCYVEKTELTCGEEETEGHAHTDECYTRQLTCGREESEEHRHTDDCYSDVLTCGLEAGAGAHTHGEACYTVTRELACGQAEGEGAHAHTDACYTAERKLTCGQAEGEGAHAHVDACYETVSELICGQTEGEGAHAHTDACYTTTRAMTCKPARDAAKRLGLESVELHAHTDSCFVEVKRGGETVRLARCGFWEIPTYTSAADCWAEEEIVTDEGHAHSEACYAVPDEPNCGKPEHAHTAGCYAPEATETDDENNVPRILYPAQAFDGGAADVRVRVEAPEGAFPEGATMRVSPVRDDATLSDIEATVAADFVEVKQVHAVDIAFFDAAGAEIEPLTPISVVMAVETLEAKQEAVVVHVDDEGNAAVVGSDEAPAVAFEANAFSVYAMVITEAIERVVKASDGRNYRITAAYGPDAGIPEGAALVVE